jgi:hypothetical protein
MANNDLFDHLDETTVRGILKSLEEGMWKKDAAVINGITEQTFHNWQRDYPEFKRLVREAILDYKRNLIVAVNVGAVKNPNIALKVLQTRWGKEWNPPKKVQLTDPEGELQKVLSILMGTADPSEVPDVENEDDIDLPKLPEEA